MADVVEPVLVNPGSSVMTPSVVSSFEISIPEDPSVDGITFNSSVLSPYPRVAVSGASTVGANGGSSLVSELAGIVPGWLAAGAGAAAVSVASGIRFSPSVRVTTVRRGR